MLNNVYSHWQWYNEKFNITVFRYLVAWFAIVPAIAKILENVPEQVIFKVNENSSLTINFQLPFTWQYLWAASLFFVIAYILYMIFCPKFIKTYSSFSDYKSHKHAPRWIAWISLDIVKAKSELPKFFERIKTKGYIKELSKSELSNFGIKASDIPLVNVQENQSVLYFEYKSKIYSLGMPILNSDNELDIEQTKEVERELFWEVFGRYSTIRKPVRIVILILLLLSLLSFSFALYENIISGSEYIIKEFFSE